MSVKGVTFMHLVAAAHSLTHSPLLSFVSSSSKERESETRCREEIRISGTQEVFWQLLCAVHTAKL